jgi:hypothetical protein
MRMLEAEAAVVLDRLLPQVAVAVVMDRELI